ncbi:MAG: histidine kinase dimerization/phospho-acceptor domain-containing protein, partial [Steroidobacteraceae bacterium]
MPARSLKTTEDPLRHANECLELMTYSLSHDLRAPLRAIDAYSRLLMEEQADRLTPPAQCYLEKLQGQVRIAQDMIAHVLRIGAKSLDGDARLLDLSSIARDIASQLQTVDPA